MKTITLSYLIALTILICNMVEAKNAGYYSQYGQDKFIHETFFSNKIKGLTVYLQKENHSDIVFSFSQSLRCCF